MKKGIIIALLVLCLAAPLRASAFSFSDFLNHGRRIFRIGNRQPAPALVEEKTIDRSVPPELRYDWKEKHRAWKQAYDNEDVSPLFQNKANFVFSEEEINYFAQKEYNTSSSTIVRNIKVDLQSGLIAVSGYSLLNYLKGDFSAEIKILSGEGGLYPKVTKARLGKLWIPAIALDGMVRKETAKLKKFLYSSLDYQKLDVVIEEDVLKLEYSK